MSFKIQGTVVINDDRTANFPNLQKVDRPVNVSPANNEQNVLTQTTFELSPYRSLYGIDQSNVEIIVSDTSDFSNVVYVGTGGSVTSNAMSSQLLSIDTTYYWYGRYADTDNVISEFSAPTQFTTANTTINAPQNLTVNTISGFVPESSNMSVDTTFGATNLPPGVSVSHVSTDWRIVRSSNGQVVFEETGQTGTLRYNINFPFGILEPSTAYSFEARFNANTFGASAYSSNVQTTSSSFTVPTVLGQPFAGGYYVGTWNVGPANYYLVIAPNSTGTYSTSPRLPFGTTSGTGLATNDGYFNTYSQLTAAHFQAAVWTSTRSINGYTDWYLPSEGEINYIYTQQQAGITFPAGEYYVGGSPSGPTGSYDVYWHSNNGNRLFNRTGPYHGYKHGPTYGPLTNTSTITRAIRRAPA